LAALRWKEEQEDKKSDFVHQIACPVTLDISPKITSIEDENNDTHLTFLKPGL
jgi:hypothetical protein